MVPAMMCAQMKSIQESNADDDRPRCQASSADSKQDTHRQGRAGQGRAGQGRAGQQHQTGQHAEAEQLQSPWKSWAPTEQKLTIRLQLY